MKVSFPFLNHDHAHTLSLDDQPWDEVLYETEHFAVVPTVGALVEGWLLIVTKEHYLCMGALEESKLNELSELKLHVSSVLKTYYGQIAIFEHGPCIQNQKIGCGVDHAHLHLLPADYSLIDAVPRVSDIRLRWERVDSSRKLSDCFNSNTPYLYLEQPLGNAYVAVACDAPSQLFRQVVADRIGIPDNFDWRHNPMKENVLSTIKMLRGEFSRQEQTCCP